MNVHGSISLILLRWRYLGKERERLSIRVPSEFCKIKRSIRYKGMTTSGHWPNPWCQYFWKNGDKLYYFLSSKQNLLFSSSWSRRRKGSSARSRRAPNFWSSQCASIASVRLLTSQWSQLSSLYQAHGLYPSNMQHNILRMLKKDLTRFRQTPGRVTISQSSYQTETLTLTSPVDISR